MGKHLDHPFPITPQGRFSYPYTSLDRLDFFVIFFIKYRENFIPFFFITNFLKSGPMPALSYVWKDLLSLR